MLGVAAMGETNGIIEQYAAHLEAKATRVVIRLTMCFGLVGAVLGGFPRLYTHNALVPAHLGYATLLLGAVAGAYLGYTFGERRALDHRMQARLALHQLQVEESLMRRVAGLPVPAAPPAPASASAPAPVPLQVQQPVPASVAAVPVAAAAIAPAADSP